MASCKGPRNGWWVSTANNEILYCVLLGWLHIPLFILPSPQVCGRVLVPGYLWLVPWQLSSGSSMIQWKCSSVSHAPHLLRCPRASRESWKLKQLLPASSARLHSPILAQGLTHLYVIELSTVELAIHTTHTQRRHYYLFTQTMDIFCSVLFMVLNAVIIQKHTQSKFMADMYLCWRALEPVWSRFLFCDDERASIYGALWISIADICGALWTSIVDIVYITLTIQLCNCIHYCIISCQVD